MATATAQLRASAVEAEVLEIIRGLLRETGKAELAESVTRNSSFERDLGLGDPDLVELILRCEERLEVELPDRIAEEADTPAAWVKAILEGGREAEIKSVYRIPPPPLDALSEPVTAKTLVEALVRHAEADPGRVQIHLLEEDSGEGITYGRLYEEASAVAAGLAEHGLCRNETVGIMLPTSAEFFFAFFGVMLAGGIPVPVYPPTRPDRIEDYVRRQIEMLRSTGIRFLISFARIKPVVQILRVNLPSLADVTTVETLRQARGRLGAGSVKTAETAVLQFTSGSTGIPKAVALSHTNVLSNIRAIGAAVEVRPGDALVSWLPLYSDLGLIGCWLLSLYYAIPFTAVSPLEFLQRPERWLWAIHRSRGTLSAGPNFAYELCARRIPAWALEGIDLSCWRVAVNAGEPVLPETVDRFSRRFARYGLPAEAMMPCYGLAEASVALTMSPAGRLPLRERVRRTEFETQGKAVPAAPDDTSALCFFSVGRPIEGQEIRLVDEHGKEAPERTVGRLLFRSRTMMAAYYRNPEATAAAVRADGWFDSGDFGYLSGGEFYFTGRATDAIVKAGRSMSPLDVEAALGSLPGVVPGSVVALGVPDPSTGAEQLVVVAETPANNQEDFRRIEAEIVRVVDDSLGMPPDRVQLVEPGCLPRTSNGKIRRNEIRALYQKGKLRTGSRPPWLQIVRLRWENLGALIGLGIRRVSSSAAELSTVVSAAAVAWAGGIWVRIARRPAAVRAACGRILRLHGRRFSAQGTELLEKGQSAVLVANRSGVLDPLVAVATLPGEIRFADATALNGLSRPLAFLLKPLVAGPDHERAVPRAGVLRRRVASVLEKPGVVVVFPDSPAGTPVLRSRYRLDPFQAAVEMGASLHPMAIRERAQPQPPGERVRVRKVTKVIVREPVEEPGAVNFFALRDKVREAIGEYHA